MDCDSQVQKAGASSASSCAKGCCYRACCYRTTHACRKQQRRCGKGTTTRSLGGAGRGSLGVDTSARAYFEARAQGGIDDSDEGGLPFAPEGTTEGR